jgi:hypothetical protein
MDAEGFLLYTGGVKSLPSSSADVKNKSNYTSSPSIWLHDEHTDNFTDL